MTVAEKKKTRDMIPPADSFARRHIGVDARQLRSMLDTLGYSTLESLIDAAVPRQIRTKSPLALPAALPEHEAMAQLRALASRNQVFRSYLGMGYHDCLTPPVILRNVLENPGWYTAYTPYQAEIAQGRLEALLNFQTMVSDPPGLDIAGASRLDEGTAAAEAMAMTAAVAPATERPVYLVDEACHPPTISGVRARAGAR